MREILAGGIDLMVSVNRAFYDSVYFKGVHLELNYC